MDISPPSMPDFMSGIAIDASRKSFEITSYQERSSGIRPHAKMWRWKRIKGKIGADVPETDTMKVLRALIPRRASGGRVCGKNCVEPLAVSSASHTTGINCKNPKIDLERSTRSGNASILHAGGKRGLPPETVQWPSPFLEEGAKSTLPRI